MDIIEEFLEQNRSRFPENQFLTSQNFFNNKKNMVLFLPVGPLRYPGVKIIRKKLKARLENFLTNVFMAFHLIC